MSKYRIVKMKYCDVSHKVQKRIFGLFWVDTYWQYKSIRDCEWWIKDELETARLKKENPRDIVVKTY
jgi:hypothetical protein